MTLGVVGNPDDLAVTDPDDAEETLAERDSAAPAANRYAQRGEGLGLGHIGQLLDLYPPVFTGVEPVLDSA